MGTPHTHTHRQPFNGLLSGTTRVPEKTFIHSHPSWSSYILYHLPPFTTIYGILFVQFMSLTVLSENLSPGPLWSSSWPRTLNFILHAFLHPIIIIFSQHMPIPTQPVLISARWSTTTFSFLTGQVSLPCNMLLLIYQFTALLMFAYIIHANMLKRFLHHAF